MARILNRVLRALDDIYSIASPSAIAPEQIDTTSALQLVHDVSREAEMGGVPGNFNGFFTGTIAHAAGTGAGVQRIRLDWTDVSFPGSPLAQIEDDLPSGEFWVWLMDTWATIKNDGNQGNLVAAQLFAWNRFNRIDFTGWGNSAQTAPIPVFQTAGVGSGGGTNLMAPPYDLMTSMIRTEGYTFRPFPLFYPTSLGDAMMQSVVNRSGDLGEILFGFTTWVGPRETLPPGMG